MESIGLYSLPPLESPSCFHCQLSFVQCIRLRRCCHDSQSRAWEKQALLFWNGVVLQNSELPQTFCYSVINNQPCFVTGYMFFSNAAKPCLMVTKVNLNHRATFIGDNISGPTRARKSERERVRSGTDLCLFHDMLLTNEKSRVSMNFWNAIVFWELRRLDSIPTDTALLTVFNWIVCLGVEMAV